MKQASKRRSRTLGTLVMLLALTCVPVMAQGGREFEVTITNLTAGQILSPPIVYSHRGGFKLFKPGEEALPELAGVAEDADSEPLLALLSAESRVHDVTIADGVVLPGASTKVTIRTRGNSDVISALGMLVTTNDAFFATGRRPGNGRVYALAPAWDAGSEANTQECEHIPGPPCGNGGVRVTDGAEGYVYIHAGIQDRGSLDPQVHDWRNPVARISIRPLDR